MNTQLARQIGGRVLLKGSIILFILIELVYLFLETIGDFANGILFFIDAQKSPYFLSFLILAFVTIYFIGRQTGNSLLVNKKSRLAVSLKHSFAASVILVLIYRIILEFYYRIENPYRLSFSVAYNIRLYTGILVITFVAFVLVWLVSSNTIVKHHVSQ